MQPIDIAKAVECLGGESVFEITVEAFLEETDGMMASLSEAVESGDFSLIKEKAHWIKGGLDYLHAKPSTEAARNLEFAAKAEDLSKVRGAYEVLNLEVAKLKNALRERGHSSVRSA